MKTKIITSVLGAMLLLTGCTGNTESAADDIKDQTSATESTIGSTTSATTESAVTEEAVEIEPERIYPDNTYKTLDPAYKKAEIAEHGTVVRFIYDTRDNVGGGDAVYQKYALAYLPAGYDENDTETRYNVMYFMHGGSDSPEWFLNGEGKTSPFSYMFDYLIANGDMEPAIICFVSYYTEYRSDDTQNCLNFHHELMNDLIPAFESKYHTYAEDVTPEGIRASRRHRAFGGFSMGAVTTWATFENRLDSIAYYMPVSGDCWALGGTAGGSRPTATAQHLADAVNSSGFTAEDFYIFTGCGGNDMAKPNLEPQVEAMKELSDTFVYCDNFADGNFYHCLHEGGGHDKSTVLNVMYNGLPKMFG
ncbi:MAG: enterochelin esterase [Oscillospiraceae bacterium]|nr:enterochelin esterase [Oscillospiraceae bacterium]